MNKRVSKNAKQEVPVQQNLMTEKAVKSLAGAIYKNLQSEGCQSKDIIGISSQLLDLVVDELKRNHSSSDS